MSDFEPEILFTRREVLAGAAIALTTATVAGTAVAGADKVDTKQARVYVTDVELTEWTADVVAGFKRGVSVIQVFSEAGAQTDNQSLRTFSTDLVAILKLGYPISDFMEINRHIFNRAYVTTVRYGEIYGEVDTALEKWLTSRPRSAPA